MTRPSPAKAQRKPAPLATVLRYRNARVVNGFLRSYDIPRAEANRVFVEMLKFLWLCQYETMPVLAEMKVLDEMWHTFILHTEEYRDFCLKFFGEFRHHDPETRISPRRARRVRASDWDRTVDRLVDVIEERLGARTVERWFVDYSERYSESNLEKLRLKPALRK